MQFLIVLGSGAFLLGLAFVVWISVVKRHAQGIANWPYVKGLVVQAGVSSLERETPTGTERTHTPVVTYEYEVAGQSYTSKQLDFLPNVEATYADRGQAQQVIAEYPAGSRAKIFYNPVNPKQSALKIPGPVAHNVVLFYGVVNMIAGAGIIALGVLLLP